MLQEILGALRNPVLGEIARSAHDHEPEWVGETNLHHVALNGFGDLHKRHKLYIEIVSSGLPLLPQAPVWLDVPELNQDLNHFRVEVLHVVDVVVSKLKRFTAATARTSRRWSTWPSCLTTGCSIASVPPSISSCSDSRAADLPKYVRNLHRVERDMLGVAETAIELPGWLDRDDD